MPLKPPKQLFTPSLNIQECQRSYKPVYFATPTPPSVFSTRTFSSSPIHQDDSGPVVPRTPRWLATPSRMMAPFRSKPPVYDNEFPVNESPEKLDQAYERVLGPGGDKMLTEEVKWLAVTHKSFDHGRRGYNDRLAFLGKRIIHLQASLSLMNASVANPKASQPDQYGRIPFQHPALDGLAGLTMENKAVIEERVRMARLVREYGLDRVIRWKPKKATDVGSSGANLVYAQAICAIVGAVALQKGGEVANRIARTRVLSPLGLK